MRSCRPLTEGTTTLSAGSVITGAAVLSGRRRALKVPDRFADGPRGEEEERRGQRSQERPPPGSRRRAGDAPREQRREQWTCDEKRPSVRALLREALSGVVTPVHVSIGAERGEAVRLVLVDRSRSREAEHAALCGQPMMGDVFPLAFLRP